MLATGAIIAFAVCDSFAIMVLITLLIKIWHPDHAAKTYYDQLKNTVKKANKGDLDAIKTCEGNQYEIKSSWGWWRKKKHFSVRPKLLYACFPL